jgi:nitrite reductase (NADH) small subunit
MSFDLFDWAPVCRLQDLVPERGAAVIVGGRQVAVFRTVDGDVRAIGNRDPFSHAFVLARGLVGTRGDREVVTSPMYKQAFDLVTGECLDAPGVAVEAYDARVRHGVVELRSVASLSATTPLEISA